MTSTILHFSLQYACLGGNSVPIALILILALDFLPIPFNDDSNNIVVVCDFCV